MDKHKELLPRQWVFFELLNTVAYLRSPKGCPWDRAQTHESLQPCLVEEAAEVLQAIDQKKDAAICEELGDLLLQVLLHAQIASERSAFDFFEIAEGLQKKLLRRHPHVFGDSLAESPEEALLRWRSIKAEERKAKGLSPDSEEPLPPALPALAYSEAILKRMEKQNRKLAALSLLSTNTIQTESDLGSALMQLVQLAREKSWDIEGALRRFADGVYEAD